MTHDPTFWLLARAAGLAAYAILSPGARTLTESEPEPVAQSG